MNSIKNHPQKKSVIIIGGGLAGLSAGVYLQKNGYSTQIFEMHSLPGGQCTSWKRGSFTFDGCAHWVIGSREGEIFYDMWKDLGVMRSTRFLDHDIYGIFSFPDGDVTVYTDAERLRQEFLKIAPEDAEEIEVFTRAIKATAGIHLPDSLVMLEKNPVSRFFANMVFMVKILPVMKWAKVKSRDYAKKFRNHKMRAIISNLFLPDFSMMFNLFTLAWLRNKNAGYPLGGSLEFSRSIEKEYLAAGGQIHYKQKVEKILVENIGGKDTATGIQTAKGKTHRADYVISAADGHFTIENLLENRFHHPRLKKAWDKLPLFPPLFYISLGIKGTLEDPKSVSGRSIVPDEPIRIADRVLDYFLVHTMDYDPHLAPKGKSILSIMINTDYDYWESLYQKGKKEYEKAKEKGAKTIIDYLDKKIYPGLKKRIEKTDIATPLTWVHYTGVHRGAYEGIQLTPDIFETGFSLPRQLKNLENFYLAGQWIEPGGGMPVAANSGRMTAFFICKKDKKKFQHGFS